MSRDQAEVSAPAAPPTQEVTDPAEEHTVGEVSHRTARSAAIRGSAEILGKVATLAWTVVAARILTPDDFGAVTYAMTVMLVLGSFASWGFDSGITRRGAAEPESLPRIYLASQVWRTGLSLVVFGVAAVVLADSPSVGSWAVLVGMLLAGFPELWSLSARSAASARQSATEVSRALIAQRVVTAVLVIGALVAGLGAVGLVGAFLVGTLVGWQGHRRAMRRLDVRYSLRRLQRVDFADAVRGTFLVGLSGLVLMLLFRLDVVMIGAFLGPADVAVYSVAYRLLETVIFVNFAINQAVLPVMSAPGTTSERRLLGWERAFAVAGFVYLPFMVVCLTEGEKVIELLFGSQYSADAAPVLAWLAPAPLLLAVGFFGSSLLLAIQRPRPLLTASVAALATNVALNLVLIPADGPYGGPVGAAIATTASYGVQAVVTMVGLATTGHRPRALVPLVCSGGAAVALAALLVPLDIALLVDIAIGAVVYLGVWALLARRFAPEQLTVVMRLLARGRPPGRHRHQGGRRGRTRR